MKLKVLGSGQEVGKSALLLEDKEKIVMDYGIKIQPSPPQYPIYAKTDYAFISHAHLDHSGASPVLFTQNKPEVYMTDVTLELSMLLIRDSVKIARKEKFPVPFSHNDRKRMIRNTKLVNLNENFRMGDFYCKLYDAGHIPGSASILLDKGKQIFYTADTQTHESHLLHGCNLPKSCDVLIIESTYGTREHPNRKEEENKLIDFAEETLAKESTLLLPSFAVGRSQEVLMMLEKYADVIAMDGMTKTASEIMSEYGSYLKNSKKFRDTLSRVKFIKNDKERQKAVGKYPIIISSAGMLGGGPAVSYLRKIKNDEHSKVVFCGFLVDDTPGRNLLQTQIFENLEEKFHVSSQLHQLNFSGHAGKKGLYKIIEKTNPELVVCVHGDECDIFAEQIQETLDIKAIAPGNGQEVNL